MNTFEIRCIYGKGTRSTCFVCETRNGAFWYVVKGSKNVNKTYNNVTNGVDVECLHDVDCFTWSKPINTIKQFERALN